MGRIDARGMSCPEPVIMTKNGLGNNPTGIEILVDNNVSVENIKRFAKNEGYNVTSENLGNDFLLKINK